jgi:5-formyltetrahydrofolate cyclo-ligase
MEKSALRRSLLKARQALSVQDWREASQRICEHLQASPLFIEAETVLAYFSVRQEPDLSPLFQLPKTWGFPRCVGKSLSWHSWCPSDRLPLQTGTYHIPEPHPDSPRLTPEQVDLILVPAVACDQQGYRLGYGGGFYDRLLASPEWTDRTAIGIVFGFAHLPHLPIDPWDCPLHAVCTEQGLYSVGNSAIAP